jgi:hypothetical protein
MSWPVFPWFSLMSAMSVGSSSTLVYAFPFDGGNILTLVSSLRSGSFPYFGFPIGKFPPEGFGNPMDEVFPLMGMPMGRNAFLYFRNQMSRSFPYIVIPSGSNRFQNLGNSMYGSIPPCV